MAFTPGAQDGQLNDTTAVDIVDAPASSVQRMVRNLIIHNADTVSVDLTVRYYHGGTTRTIYQITLAADDTLELNLAMILDDTDKKIQALLGGAVTTNQPNFVASYADNS